MVEERIGGDFDFVKVNVRVAEVHANGRRIADEMNVVAARRQFLAQFRGDYAGPAVRWIACNANAHELLPILERGQIAARSYDTLFRGQPAARQAALRARQREC